MRRPDRGVSEALVEEPPRSSASTRTGWTIASQVLSSTSNFGIGIVVARAVGTKDFGAFGIAIATYLLIAGALRAAVGEPLIVRFSAAPAEQRHVAATSAANAALGVGIVSGALIAGVFGLGRHGAVAASMLALAVCLPGLALQDAWRYAFFALGRPRSAAINDGLWILFQVMAVGTLLARGHPGAPALLLAWGLAGSCAGACGFLQARPSRPSLWRCWDWPLRHRDLGGRFFTEFLASFGTSQLCLYGLGILSGLTAVASVRGALTLLGPVSIIYTGVTITGIIEGARLRHNERKLRHLLKLICVALILSTAAWLAILLAIPFGVGTNILGASWSGARSVLLGMGAAYVLNGVMAGAIVGLRVRQDAVRSLRARLQILPFAFGLPLAGAQGWGPIGFAVGTALASAVGVWVWWYQYTRGRRAEQHFEASGTELASSAVTPADDLT